MLFNRDESKIIAEFYTANYGILSSQGSGPNINARRTQLLKKLTGHLNSRRPTNQVTINQVKQKIRDLKKNSKKKAAQNSKVRRPTGGGEDESVPLTAAEEIISAKLGNTPAFLGIPGGGLETGVDDDDVEDEEDQEADDDSGNDNHEDIDQNIQDWDFTQESSGLQLRQQQSFTQSATIRRPNRSLTQSRSSQFSASTRYSEELGFPLSPRQSGDTHSAVNVADEPSTSNAPLTNTSTIKPKRKNVNPAIQLNQEREGVLKQQKEVLDLQKTLMESQLKATEEFRRFIVEYRLHLRGTNLSEMPLEVPPDLLEYAARLIPQVPPRI